MTSSSTQTSLAGLEARIASVRDRIDRAAEKSGRSAADVTLVAVCKTVERHTVDEAYAAGLRDFGENRVQDALRKFEDDVPDDLNLHMIGPLQTNKANQVLGRFSLVHSLDRLSLAKALNKRAVRDGIVQPVLIQVNVAREEQKHGVLIEDLPELIDTVIGMHGLRLDGFMTMAPFVATPEEVRPVFAKMREIATEMAAKYPDHPMTEISMGMTNDFDVAIEEGATIVRVGRAIFEERSQS